MGTIDIRGGRSLKYGRGKVIMSKNRKTDNKSNTGNGIQSSSRYLLEQFWKQSGASESARFVVTTTRDKCWRIIMKHGPRKALGHGAPSGRSH